MQIEPEEKPETLPENAKKVDLDAPVNNAKDKANQILKNLKSTLQQL